MTTWLLVPLREGLHDLTWDQRIVWGRCPSCNAEPGERCHSEILPDGVHLPRLDAAPARVRIEALR